MNGKSGVNGMNGKRTAITDLLMERYLCGEITGEEKQLVEERYAADAEVKARIDSLKVSNERILAEHSPETVAGEILLRDHLQTTSERLQEEFGTVVEKPVPFGMSAGAFAGTLLLLFGIPLLGLLVNRQVASGDAARVKGLQPSLSLYRADDRGYSRLRNYAPAVSGDRLQIGYRAAGKSFGLIFSVDGSGALTLHFPDDSDGTFATCRLAQGGEQLLHTSFELDSAPLFERFYFLTSDDSIATADILQRCRNHFSEGGIHVALRIRSLPQSIRQTTFTLKKD